MRFEFVHFADAHVGTEQYKAPVRYNDFGRTYLKVVTYCCAQRVRFVIVAGDLFNSDDIWAMTHDQVHAGLDQLRQAGIPVLAVRGNHERVRGPNRSKLWLQSLAGRGLLRLLDIEVGADNRVALLPFDPEKGTGGYVDLDGVRIAGLGYQGSTTAAAIQGAADALAQMPREGIEYTILIAHAAMQGYLPNYEGGLTAQQMAPLEPYVDYVALGHIHKAYQVTHQLPDGTVEPWILNPGSLDTFAINEAEWDRGYYHVTVDTEARPRHDARLCKPLIRPVLSVSLKVNELTCPQLLHEAVRAALLAQAEQQPRTRKPIAQVCLEGTLHFDRRDLDIEAIQEVVRECCDPLVALVKDHTTSVESSSGSEGGQSVDLGQLEYDTFRDSWAGDVRYRDQAAEYARLTSEVKGLLLSDAPPEKIAAELRQRREALEQPPPTEASALPLNGQLQLSLDQAAAAEVVP